MGGRGRTGPKEKRGGLSLPVDHWAIIDKLEDLRSKAWKLRGGETKQTTSGELALAIEAHHRDCLKKYGPLPVTKAEEEAYVKRMADVDQREAMERLNRAS